MTRTAAESKAVAVTLIDSFEYSAWLAQLAEKDSRTKSAIVRIALREWAERNGHELPPKAKVAA